MIVSRRLNKELEEMKALTYFRDVTLNEGNFLHWTGLLVPEHAPYNKGVFSIEIIFPSDYPFKPPKLRFITKIYHPNVDEQGRVCMGMITSKHWKPTTKSVDVMEALMSLLNNPDPYNPLRINVAEELLRNPKIFYQKAEEYTVAHAGKRPLE